MKTLFVAAVLAFGIGYFAQSERSAEAIVGLMCINTDACGNKCEVCVKAKETDPSGKCMKISGCY